MSGELNLSTLTTNQTGKEASINDIAAQLEAAVAARLVVDVSAGGGAVTDAQMRRAAVIIATGATVARTVTLAAVSRVLTVVNGGGAPVTFARGTGNVTLAAGKAVGIALDGTTDGLAVVGSVGGAETFLGLGDTPSAYTGAGGKLVAVKSDASGLEFIAAPTGGGSGLPNGGVAGDVLTKNSATNGDAGWTAPTGGGGSAVGAHRYWMLDNMLGSGALSIAELNFRATAGGADLTRSAAAAKDAYDGSTVAANMIDGNVNTLWAGASSPGWAYIDLGSAQTVLEGAITARNDGYYGQRPTSFMLMFSDDAVTWTPLRAYHIAAASSAGQVTTFPIPSTR